MSIFTGHGEVDRKLQQDHCLPRIDQRHHGPTHHQKMAAGSGSSITAQGHSPYHQHSGAPGAGSTYRNVAGASGYPSGYVEQDTSEQRINRNKQILKNVNILLETYRKTWLHDHEARQTVKEFDAAYGELLQLVSGKEQARPDPGDKRHLEHRLEKSEKMVDDLSRELMSHRLSASMNMQLSTNETVLENVSIKTRPMNIATEYSNMCSTEWHNAKEELDRSRNRLKEEYKLHFLSKILLKAEEEALELKKKFFRKLETCFADPVTWVMTENPNVDKKTEAEVSPALTNALSDHLRLTAEKADLTVLCKKISKDIGRECSQFSQYLSSKAMVEYIQSCVCLAWKMVIQRPAMRFDSSTGVHKMFDDKTQDLQWGTKDPKTHQSTVAFYVLPALMHGDRIMVKGKVWIK